jgi:hypothetical protein
MDYKDFVLQLDRAAAEPGFVTRVLHSPAGEAEAPFVNPLSRADLDRLWQEAYSARQASRAARAGSARLQEPLTESHVEEIGDRLFHALFRGPVHSCWMRSLSEATRHSDGGLRLKLQLNLADPLIASFAELPWELLFSPEQGGFLGLQRKTPILRHMRLPLPGSRPLPARPIRVLTVLSQPAAMAELSLEEEAGKIDAALRTLPGVEVLPLHNPTIETLRENLLRQDFQILHFMGHGGFDERSGQGVLCFTGDRGESIPVSGSMLATHLAGMDSLRLIFVNACETARSNTAAPFAGVATALLRAGLPAVIAMQRPISDDAALEFSRTVYRRLAAGDPIDAAVTEGRLAIFRDNGSLQEWGTPVLFSRAEDGRIFAADAPAVQPALAEPVQASITSSEPMPTGIYKRIVLGILLVAGLGLAAWRSPFFDRGADRGDIQDTFVMATPTPAPAETPTLELETPPKPHDEEDRLEPEPTPTPPPVRFTYELGDGDSVRVSGLEAEVGAQFFERAGYTTARFSVSPKDLGMLQQPPVMGTGTIDFPVENGTYHLDVLSLDRAAKRAKVRLRFEPSGSS